MPEGVPPTTIGKNVPEGSLVVETVGEVWNRMSLPSAARSLALGRIGMSDLALRTSPVRYERHPSRPLPDEDFVRVRMTKAGICGSDLSSLKGTMSAKLSPFSSFPAVMGHEGTGTVVEAGAVAPAWSGKRVVGDPFLGCAVRGLAPCPACDEGRACLCTHMTEGRFAAGMILGVCKDLPGTWAEETFFHESQLHAVPDGVGDDRAVLVEPLAVSVHAVLTVRPAPGERALVIGDGPIAMLTIAALNLLGHGQDVTAVVRHPERLPGPAAFGAGTVLRDTANPVDLAEALGATTVRALDGSRIIVGGADVVYDCVGSTGGLALSLAAVRPAGRICLVGSPGRTNGLDVSSLWAREIALTGVLGYGAEPSFDGRHTFDVTMELLAAHPEVKVEELITHRFPLADAVAALALFSQPQLTAGKVVLEIS